MQMYWRNINTSVNTKKCTGVFARKYRLGLRICLQIQAWEAYLHLYLRTRFCICACTYAHAYTSDDAYAGANADATATAATATLGSTPTPPDTRTHAHATANSCCPSVEPHPFRSNEHTTASGTPDEHTLATDLPGSGPACTHLKMR